MSNGQCGPAWTPPPTQPSGSFVATAATWVRTHKLISAVIGVVALIALGSALPSDTTSKPRPASAGATPAFSPETVATQQPSPSGRPSPSPSATPATTAAPLALVAPAPTPSPTRTSPRPAAPTPTKASPRPKPRTAAPSPAAKTYANCTELRKDYPGGVALPGAVNQGGKTQHQPYYSKALYDANSSKDRDHDGIACEA